MTDDRALTGRTRVIEGVTWYEMQRADRAPWWVPCPHFDDGKQIWIGFPDGRRQLRRRCVRCGMPFGTQLRAAAESNATFMNASAIDEYESRISDGYRVLSDEHEAATTAAKDAEDKQWRTAYEAHLRSPRWQSIRDRVFKRCNGTCEGCGLAIATEVHHLTYAHMGNELLWELVGVCRQCHAKAHERGAR